VGFFEYPTNNFYGILCCEGKPTSDVDYMMSGSYFRNNVEQHASA